MAGRIILDACNPALDASGQIDDLATLTFYENGTTTLQSIYDASDLLTPLPNPLSPNAAGQFPVIWGDNGDVYSVKWEMGDGTIVTFDDIGTVNNLIAASDSCFSAINLANQATTTGASNKILFPSVVLDPLGDFSNSRHTPKAAGFYNYSMVVSATSSTGVIQGLIGTFVKNGTSLRAAVSMVGPTTATSGTMIGSGFITVYMNGTTDYMEVFATAFGGGTLNFDGAVTYFCSFSGGFLHS